MEKMDWEYAIVDKEELEERARRAKRKVDDAEIVAEEKLEEARVKAEDKLEGEKPQEPEPKA